MSIEQLAAALEEASCSSDVAELIRVHSYEAVAAAWPLVNPVQRGALALCRNTGGTIVHELSAGQNPKPGHPG